MGCLVKQQEVPPVKGLPLHSPKVDTRYVSGQQVLLLSFLSVDGGADALKCREVSDDGSVRLS